MKKWLFGIIFLIVISLANNTVTYADFWYGDDYGLGTINKVWFVADIEPGSINSKVSLLIEVYNDKNIQIEGLYIVNSDGTESYWADGNIFDIGSSRLGTLYEIDNLVISNNVDFKCFRIKFRHELDSYSTLYTLDSSMRYTVTPTPTPTEIPTPTPTSTPTPRPTSTPVPTVTPRPTSTPTPRPTSTPVPTATPRPTSTPTPTPTVTPIPEPELYLYAYADNGRANADYKTGGCTPVKSIIEYYEVNSVLDTLRKIESETFLCGEGSRNDYMQPGVFYRYKLTYIYEFEGVQYTKELWSTDLYLVDEELNDYNSNKRITNFRTLMICLWEYFYELEVPIDGYLVSVKEIFMWCLLALLCIYFIREFMDR